jgi:glycosyltransferase involved in cell wall biosynthesis
MTGGHSAGGRVRYNGGPDRSWRQSAPVRVSSALINAWRTEADAAGTSEVDTDVTDGHDGPDLLPGISVVMPSYRGRAHIGRCLRSLAAQTLEPELFEIIVVLNGPDDGTREILDEFRQTYPAVTLRVIAVTVAGASRAWNAGIAAAAREYTTFVDDDDYVSPAFLQVLLANAGPRVVPIASIIDVFPDGKASADNYLNNALVPLAGRRVAAPDIRVATSSNAPKAVATNLIKDQFYPLDFLSGQDVVFWTTLVVRHQVDFFPCVPSDGAVYYRSMRHDSMSRQTMSFDFNVRQRLDVIAELDQLVSRSENRIRELVLDRIRAQAGFIAKYLDEHPQDHPRVVELLDRRPIFNFPYDRITGSRATGLAIAYAFPPYNDTSAVVMAKRVRVRGEIVDVIQNDMTRIRETDDSLRRISGPFVGRQAALKTPSYFADWGSMEKFSVEGLKTIARWEQAKGARYSWLYSRAQFAASHFLAAGYKAANPAASWIAEFSDPLSRDVQGQERGTKLTESAFVADLVSALTSRGLPVPASDNCFTWCEEIAYGLADKILFTNVNQLEYMLSYCSRPEFADIARTKAVIDPQPTLPDQFYMMVDHDYPLADQLVHLAYFGNFYATRGMDDILVAIAEADEWIRRHLRLHVFTSKPTELQLRAEQLGISDVIAVGSYVRYLEFLNLSTRFDCLIVNDAITAGSHTRNPYLPSKWSDYRGSGREIWGVVENGSPLSRQSLAYVSAVGDVAGAGAVLARLVRRKLGFAAYDEARSEQVAVG